MSECNSSEECTRENLFQQRIISVLENLSCLYPTLSVHADFLRITAISQTGFPDDAQEIYVRLAEGVSCFLLQKKERWFDTEVGIIHADVSYLVMPQSLEIHANDHAIFKGESWLITEVGSQAGMSLLKIDNRKSRLKIKSRMLTTYRQLDLRANIL
jgi:hypothetical protein